MLSGLYFYLVLLTGNLTYITYICFFLHSIVCPVHLDRISGLREHVWLSKDGHQVARQASKNVNCGCAACVLKQNKLWIWGSVEEYRLRVLKNNTAPVKVFGRYGKEEHRFQSSTRHLWDDGSNVHHDFDLKFDAAFAFVDDDERSPVNGELRSSFLG